MSNLSNSIGKSFERDVKEIMKMRFEESHDESPNTCKRLVLKQVGIVIGCTKCAFTLYSWSNLDGSRNKKFLDIDPEDFENLSKRVNELMFNLTFEEKEFENRPSWIAHKEKLRKREILKKKAFIRIIKKAAIKLYSCKVLNGWDLCEFATADKVGLEQHMLLDHSENDLMNAVERLR